MKFSPETLEILDNFCSINPSIMFREGSTVTTKSPVGNIAALAKVSESFEKEFCIYDLKKFLGVLSLFDDAELKYGDNQATISSKKTKIKYIYADPEAIVKGTDPKNIPDLGKSYVDFTLTPEIFNSVIKASSVLSTSEISIEGDGEKVLLKSFNKKDPSSDSYSLEIGETDKKFNIIFQKDSLKLLPLTYNVTIHKTPKVNVATFASDKITYFISLDKDSSFE